jgi:hypothetical protein
MHLARASGGRVIGWPAGYGWVGGLGGGRLDGCRRVAGVAADRPVVWIVLGWPGRSGRAWSTWCVVAARRGAPAAQRNLPPLRPAKPEGLGVGLMSRDRQAGVAQERIGQVWRAADPLDAAVGLVNHLAQAGRGEVGQLYGLEAGPQALDRLSSGA